MSEKKTLCLKVSDEWEKEIFIIFFLLIPSFFFYNKSTAVVIQHSVNLFAEKENCVSCRQKRNESHLVTLNEVLSFAIFFPPFFFFLNETSTTLRWKWVAGKKKSESRVWISWILNEVKAFLIVIIKDGKILCISFSVGIDYSRKITTTMKKKREVKLKKNSRVRWDCL